MPELLLLGGCSAIAGAAGGRTREPCRGIAAAHTGSGRRRRSRAGRPPAMAPRPESCPAIRRAGCGRAREYSQQPLRVGMARRGEDIFNRAFLDNLPGIHHRHLLRNARHHAQVMGDQHHRDAQLGLQVGQQAQNLRLDGDVQRGAGLVGDQQFRAAHQRHRNHHALAQAARQLVRILRQALPGRGNAHFFQQLHGAVARLLLAGVAVVNVVLGQLLANGVGRVQRRHGFLEDHRHLAAAQRIDAAAARGGQVFTQHRQAARAALGGLGQQAHDGQRGHRLAAARFAHQAQRFAAPDLERHVAHRVQRPARRGDVHRQPLHVQNNFLVVHGQPLSSGVSS
ncbi:Uncharacterised protein [Achromobacter denitrificans]|nr:Uncharacterised protein [Achromobacter denitrificans]